MKRPYRPGDWFAIPLGDGRYAVGIVARGTRKAIAGYVFGECFEGVPSQHQVAELDASRALWSGSFSDRAMVEDRWPVIGGHAAFASSDWPLEPAYRRVLSPLVLERLVATGALPSHRRVVRDLYAAVDAAALERLPDDTQLQWRSPPSSQSLEAVAAWIATRPHASIRLYGDALASLAEFARMPHVRTLIVGEGDLPATLPVFSDVRRLELEQMLPAARLVRAFPRAIALRVAAGDSAIDMGPLETLDELRVLDCSGGVVEGLESLARMPQLAALRLSRTRGLPSVDVFAETRIRALSLEHDVRLTSLVPLARMSELEQLELRGLWQFNVADMRWLAACRTLRRTTIDIGGRRKNVEIYRRAVWAAAWPFAWIAKESCETYGSTR
ncbi:MAG TPA: Imm26 family immunity protein [Candidatus Dormibacteraeota bacterium]|nr:Imm26 family immunity protein [Candidatus Dormibacteraeota bacterium]